MNRTKLFLKIWVLALALLFAVALAFAVTGAAYNASRKADGSLSMANGIVIDYSGFGKAQDGEWQNEQTTTFKLFADRAIVPGDTVSLNSAAIKKGTDSIDFYARIKFEYKFYDALDADITTAVGNEYTNFISTPAFNSAWVDGNNNDGWFYYATGTTLNTLPASFVNIFSSSAINVELNVAGFNHEGGGYKFTDANSNEITIAKVEAILTLEAVQTTGSTWEINPLVQNSSSQVVEIYSNEITLGNVGGAYKLGTGEAGSLAYDTTTLGTTLKIVVAGDSQINANAFENSTLENVYIGDADYINGVSGYSARIYSTPATFIIGANAFSGCSSLDVYLSSSCNYQIYASSLAGVGNVYYDGVLRNDLKSPSVGAIAGTTITVLANPSIVTGGTGAINESSDSDKGDYTYEDEYGNVWYFDLGYYTGAFIKDNENSIVAQVKYCDMIDKSTNGQTINIPTSFFVSEISGNVEFISLTNYHNVSFFSDKDLINSVIIPNSILFIETYAFCNLRNMVSISVPSSIRFIGLGAFKFCSSLISFNIPHSIISMGSGVFAGCVNLASFSGGNQTYQISTDNRCLLYFTDDFCVLEAFAPFGLLTYSIPVIVTTIRYNAFDYLTNISSITIPSSVKSIESRAFANSGLQTIDIPSSVEIIQTFAFENCSQLTTVIINGQISSVGLATFQNCSSLTNLTLPVSVTSIGDYAFSGCSSLQSINWSASYNLGAEKNNEVVTLVKATTGLTLGDINLPDATDLAAAGVTAPTGQVFAGWTDGETTYTTTAPIATVRAGLTAVWENE